jgi:hypothetical protein
VLLFVDGRLVEATAPSLVRPDLVQQFKDFGVAKAGFRFTGVPAPEDGGEAGGLVALALYGNGASQLKRSP